MAGTRDHSTHLAHLINLAFALFSHIPVTPARLIHDATAVNGHLAIARTIATRYDGDHTAWDQISSNVTHALGYMGRVAAVRGFDAVRDDFIAARDLCRAYLAGLTHEQRAQLAAFEGFRNAHLVEENHRDGQDPALVLVLNPVYSPDSLAKQRVQAKADARFVERHPDLVIADIAVAIAA
ncbi:hypothetical protein [Nonomuraea dietziae]|uniref:hypothetical protein n=1 Tax=Nonomuraea dietziae TaxID=65515 RepID=UPI0033F92338